MGNSPSRSRCRLSHPPDRRLGIETGRASLMPKLWVAVYHSREPEEPPHSATVTAAAFHTGARSGTFPYDAGDDPAFFSARFHDGPVTWGVCRHDVRSAIEPGDWVVFFSAGPGDRDRK